MKDDDFEYYQQEHDLFAPSCLDNYSPDSKSSTEGGLVAFRSTLERSSVEILSSFSKIIEVRQDEDDENDDDDSSDDETDLSADISVNALGELRALTMCSYAFLSKKM